MIIAAAACPCPPLLARELTGQQEVLPELRAACAEAVGWLAGTKPDLLVVVGPGEETAAWPANGRFNQAAYAPALATGRAVGLTPSGDDPVGAGQAEAARPPVPLALGIGARLLDEAGYAGPRALHAVAATATPQDCASLGAQLAAQAPRVALLVMGDGTARRGTSAPGYLDERAEPFDASVEQAFRAGDLNALAALDPELAAGLMAVGRPAWQALAGALTAGRDDANRAAAPGTRVLYADAPLGVAYLVATLEPR